MSKHLVGLVLALLLAGACADKEADQVVASTTTTTTRSDGATSSTTSGSTTTTASGPRTACPSITESSPATFDAAQGTYATFIKGFDGPTSTARFDVVQWLAGSDAVDAYHQDNPEDPDGPPNDYYIVNESDRVRSAPVRADAQVWLVRLRTTGSASVKPGSVAELPGYLAQGYPEDVYWLTMSDGSVVDVCEQYRP